MDLRSGYPLGQIKKGLLVTYSMIAAGTIADLCLGRENADAHIFRFER